MTPAEWLLEWKRLGNSWLLEKHGGDAIGAGYELATMKNAARSYVAPTPTRAEVCSAARQITGSKGFSLSMIATHCRTLGLEVLD